MAENIVLGNTMENIRRFFRDGNLSEADITYFYTYKGKIPLCEYKIMQLTNGERSFQCDEVGPLPWKEFQEVCIQCQAEFEFLLKEEERLYYRAVFSSRKEGKGNVQGREA
jgi:hypothetical protein